MKKYDFIIVGLGIGGLSLAETLRKEGKSFILIDDGQKGATTASGGVLNPTVLKRFTAAWNALEFYTAAIPFYKELEALLDTKVLHNAKVRRILNSVEEQNNWMVASDKADLKKMITSEIFKNQNDAINAPYGLGEVHLASQIYPAQVIESYRNYLHQEGLHINETFTYEDLRVVDNSVQYKYVTADRIIFAEGAQVRHNPFFPVPVSPLGKKVFVGNKGEYIIIKASKLQSKEILKGGVMLIPLGDDLYKVGASYGRDVFTTNTTETVANDISEKLTKMLHCKFEIVNQVTGVRPTVKDRKPLIGWTQERPEIIFFNGLGTRGLSMAPLLAQQLANCLLHNIDLPSEINLQRFL